MLVQDGTTWLTRTEVVRLARRHGRRRMTESTFSGYVTRGHRGAPRPGRHVGRTPLWDKAAVLAWLES